MDKFSELKAAAMASTPGPWGIDRTGNTIVSNQSHPLATVSDAFHRQLAGGGVGKDAEFIAAANPAVVLALLAELEAKDKRIAELEVGHQEVAKQIASWRRIAKQNIEEREKDLAALDAERQKITGLEAKLATPVRLPDSDIDSALIMAHWCSGEEVNAWVKGINYAKQQIRAAGFTVEGDDA